MKRITEYEILDHGVDHSQYFRGCGVSFTKYDDVATGHGRSLYEALENALDELQGRGYEIESNIDLVDECANANDNDDVKRSFSDTGEEEQEDHELYYYASIRVISGNS